MSFAERLKMFNQGPKTNPTQANPKPEIKKFNQDRLGFLNQINNSGKEKNPPSKTKPNKLVNIFEKDKDKKETPNMPTKDRKQTILEKSSIISDENADKIIRKYPKL
jgi:phage-related tail protein